MIDTLSKLYTFVSDIAASKRWRVTWDVFQRKHLVRVVLPFTLAWPEGRYSTDFVRTGFNPAGERSPPKPISSDCRGPSGWHAP